MKPNQEKILLEDLIGCYTPETIASYRNDAQYLAGELKDIHTLSLLAQTQFSDIVVDVKKKSLEYDKAFRTCDRPSKELAFMLPQFMNRSISNYDLAYKIHSLQPISNSHNSHKSLLTQLKLKFLQSEGVDEDKWSRWFSPQEKLLILSDKSQRYEIKIGIGLENEIFPKLIWQVCTFPLESRHPLLFAFVNEYIAWLRRDKQDCQGVLLAKIDGILNNIEIVLLFLNLREQIWKKGGQWQQEKMSIVHNKVGNIVFSWDFQLFENIEKAKLYFFVNNEKFYELHFDRLQFKGKITFKHENLPQITLHTSKSISLLTNGYLYRFSCKLYNYSLRSAQFWQNYLYLQSATSIILNISSINWTPEQKALSEQEISSITNQGLWGKVNSQNSIIFIVQQDLSLTYGQFQKGYFSYLLSKLSLQNTLLHLRLRKQISKHNRQYQFKSYRVSYLQKQREIMYEFRSFKYSQHQKMFRILKADEQSMHLMNESNDNFVIICRIAHDFSKVSYSSYKYSQGPTQEKQITDNFLPKKWKEYKQTQTKIYNWRMVYECISYLCKCYLVERSYNRRMTEQQRKFTTYSFK